MFGQNTIRLNEASVKAGLQYYFDNVLYKEGKSPKITSVKAGGNQNYGASIEFELTVISENLAEIP